MTEQEFNRRVEIETQMAADRERAAAEKQRVQELNDPSRRKRMVEAGSGPKPVSGSVVRRPAVGARKPGGLTASSSAPARSGPNGGGSGGGGGGGGGSVVKRPQVKRRPGPTF